jgi:hypothetical protein
MVMSNRVIIIGVLIAVLALLIVAAIQFHYQMIEERKPHELKPCIANTDRDQSRCLYDLNNPPKRDEW